MRKLDLDYRPILSKSEETSLVESVKKASPKSVLEAFENIVELVEDSNLSEEFFEKALTSIRYAGRKLKLSDIQIVLLANFVDRSEDNCIRISEIASYMGCRTLRILRLSDHIDILEQKHYIRGSRSRNSLSYRVPADVLKALRSNQPYVYEESPVKDTLDFFERFAELVDEKEEDEITHDQLLDKTLEMLEEIKDTVFARELKTKDLDEKEDILLFIHMAHLFVENNDDNIMFHNIDDIYDNRKIPSRVKNELRGRSSDLFSSNLIENVNEDGLANPSAFKLTEKAKEEMLCELSVQRRGKSDKCLIKADTLTQKTLIYNAAESKQINELSSILSEERFCKVQERLQKAGMRRGFCCIFYGAPGTGKTETVYQLARHTGRDILRVDVDKIKSCWVGESEKNIKMLFDRYRNICKDREKAPILLFNEADAVLGVRMEGATNAVDKMENSIQNIILQEMEQLDGIMIATTNLTTNLDRAFERRFLYKIKFEKPTVEARAEIWKAMLPDLKSSEAKILASKFDLSGGEIENVARKNTVQNILFGNDSISLDELFEACSQERISKSDHKKIGF